MKFIHTNQLRLHDRVIREDDQGHIRDIVTLEREIEPISCKGRHFITTKKNIVCYVPGIVEIMNRK